MAVVDPGDLLNGAGTEKPPRKNPSKLVVPPPADPSLPPTSEPVSPSQDPAMADLLRRIQEAEERADRAERLAREATAKAESGSVKPEDLPVDYDTESLGERENIVVHFVSDGLTSLGQVWYRGQELEIKPGSVAHKETCDRNGNSWLDLRDDPAAQEVRWGREMFRSGPWPGKSYLDADGQFERLQDLPNGQRFTQPTREDLERAASAEASRRRAAPVVRAR